MLYTNIKLKRSHSFALDVELSLETPQVYALFGPSGSGKSTLLRVIAGFEKNAEAIVTFNGQTYQDKKQIIPPQQRDIGFVSQHDDLFPHLTLLENIVFANRRADRKKKNRPYITTLTSVLQLNHRLNHYPHQLSKGEQQRGKLARALIQQPQLLLLDEPFSNIDHNSKRLIINYIKQCITLWQIPVIFVSHNFNEILTFSEFLFAIEQGRLISQGPTAAALTDLDNPISQSDLASSILYLKHKEYDDKHQLTIATIDNQTLFFHTPSENLLPCYRIAVFAKDVSLFKNRPHECSVLNILQTTISAIESIDLYCIIKLQIDSQSLLAKITKHSLETLQLQVGDTIYAAIKSVALITTTQQQGTGT